jgi:hypothetical protein
MSTQINENTFFSLVNTALPNASTLNLTGPATIHSTGTLTINDTSLALTGGSVNIPAFSTAGVITNNASGTLASVVPLTTALGGTGVTAVLPAGYVTYSNGTTNVAGSNGLFYNATNNYLGVGTAGAPAYALDTGTTGFTHTAHLVGSTAVPTLVNGTGAGTGSSNAISTNANDIAGQIGINTGTAPVASSTVATLTFHTAYATAPIVILTPGNAKAAALNAGQQVYVLNTSVTTTQFVLESGTTGLTALTTFIWNYHIIA